MTEKSKFDLISMITKLINLQSIVSIFPTPKLDKIEMFHVNINRSMFTNSPSD